MLDSKDAEYPACSTLIFCAASSEDSFNLNLNPRPLNVPLAKTLKGFPSKSEGA